MNRQEALRALADGKKVRQCRWRSNSYLKLTQDGLESCDPYRSLHERIEDMSAFNTNAAWELYEEPKRYASSLEEALRATQVFWTWPQYIGMENPVRSIKDPYWSVDQITEIQAALALNCKIEIVE